MPWQQPSSVSGFCLSTGQAQLTFSPEKCKDLIFGYSKYINKRHVCHPVVEVVTAFTCKKIQSVRGSWFTTRPSPLNESINTFIAFCKSSSVVTNVRNRFIFVGEIQKWRGYQDWQSSIQRHWVNCFCLWTFELPHTQRWRLVMYSV